MNTENTVRASKPRLRKFHIGTGQSDQEIIDQFVVRKSQLGTILEVLEGNLDAESCQHLLIVAPRGRGKTTLLVRVMAELRTNEKFSTQLLPIRLMEESQEIFTLADFWLECLYYLAKSCAELDSALADQLVAEHAALAEDWTDKRLEGRARAAVLDVADRLNRRLVIMAENLQSLCDEADKNFGWCLRQVLQSEPQVMLLATATTQFEALDAKEPFFEMFRYLLLPPLDVAECRVLWQAITGEKVDERGIRPLRILTGGSPRLMVVMAGFTMERSLRQLMDQLVSLIDDHTEYFRGQLDELASTERRVYIALIDLWQASTTAEVAARARMDIRTASSLLGRLVKRGAVVADGAGKKRTYYAAERLYSIYYKLRRDRDEATVVHNLVHFMVTYYRGDALADLSRSLVAEAIVSDGIREGLMRAAAQLPELRELVEGYGLLLSAPTAHSDDMSPDVLSKLRQRFESADYAALVAKVDQWLIESDSRTPTADSTTIAAAIFWKALAQDRLGDASAAIETYASVVERYGESEERELQVQVAMALVNQGVAQSRLGDSSAAIETYSTVVERFGVSKEPALQELVAMALVNQGVVQGRLGDVSAAIETCASVAERYGDSEDCELQVQVAMALVNQGVAQSRLGDASAAIETYASVVERFGASKEFEMQVRVARALVNQGIAQGRLGDSSAEFETYASVVERFGASEESELQESVAKALVNQGVVQSRLGDSSAAIDIYASVVERYGTSEDRELQELVAMALVFQGINFGQLGDTSTEIETYTSVVERFGASEEGELQVQVAIALVNQGVAQSRVGDITAAIDTYASVVERFGLSSDQGLQVGVAKALIYQGMAQDQLGDMAAAIEAYASVIKRFGTSEELELQGLVARATGHAGEAFCLIGATDNALQMVDQLRALAQRSGVQSFLHRADWVDAMAHAALGEMSIVEQRFSAICARFDPNDDVALRTFQEDVPTLVALGAAPMALAQIIEEDEAVRAALRPLAVALRCEAGEKVRAPAEMLEIADDIQAQIESIRKNIKH